MPWIIISANGEELERRELSPGSPIVIGRSPECDVVVRDILLSRTHCRLEPAGGAWRVVDLGSKNGTRVGWQSVKSHLLRDGDHLRTGRTRIDYRAGPFEPPPCEPRRADRLVRPADPHEALSGTVTDFVLIDEEEVGASAVNVFDQRPHPQPRPLEPDSYAEPEITTLLDELARSCWSREQQESDDGGAAVLAVAAAVKARPVARALPRVARPIYKEIRRPRGAETDLSLQVDGLILLPEAVTAPQPDRSRRRLLVVVAWVLAGAFATAVVVMSAWLLTMAP
jgi:predicted component of type VI protein secretion system